MCRNSFFFENSLDSWLLRSPGDTAVSKGHELRILESSVMTREQGIFERVGIDPRDVGCYVGTNLSSIRVQQTLGSRLQELTPGEVEMLRACSHRKRTRIAEKRSQGCFLAFCMFELSAARHPSTLELSGLRTKWNTKLSSQADRAFYASALIDGTQHRRENRFVRSPLTATCKIIFCTSSNISVLPTLLCAHYLTNGPVRRTICKAHNSEKYSQTQRIWNGKKYREVIEGRAYRTMCAILGTNVDCPRMQFLWKQNIIQVELMQELITGALVAPTEHEGGVPDWRSACDQISSSSVIYYGHTFPDLF